MARGLQNFLLPMSKMSYGVGAYNIQSCVSVIMLDTVLFSLPFLSFFPLFFIFSFLFSIPSSPYFFLLFSFPSCLQNGVGAYERRSLARKLCRALVDSVSQEFKGDFEFVVNMNGGLLLQLCSQTIYLVTHETIPDALV